MNDRMKVLTPGIVDGRIEVREGEEMPSAPDGARCPFHGLVGNRHGLLMGGPAGNACALTFAHAPCRMEMEDEVPAWDRCRHYNTPARKPEVDAVIDQCAVVTTGPGSRESTAADWFARVIGRPYRPTN